MFWGLEHRYLWCRWYYPPTIFRQVTENLFHSIRLFYRDMAGGACSIEFSYQTPQQSSSLGCGDGADSTWVPPYMTNWVGFLTHMLRVLFMIFIICMFISWYTSKCSLTKVKCKARLSCTCPWRHEQGFFKHCSLLAALGLRISFCLSSWVATTTDTSCSTTRIKPTLTPTHPKK